VESTAVRAPERGTSSQSTPEGESRTNTRRRSRRPPFGASPVVVVTEPTRFETEVSYTDGEARLASPVTYEWNHGLGEIVQAVLDAGMVLSRLEEHDAVEWQALPWMVRGDDGRFRLPSGSERVPLSYTLEACRPS
jgi:hypothetical protein